MKKTYGRLAKCPKCGKKITVYLNNYVEHCEHCESEFLNAEAKSVNNTTDEA